MRGVHKTLCCVGRRIDTILRITPGLHRTTSSLNLGKTKKKNKARSSATPQETQKDRSFLRNSTRHGEIHHITIYNILINTITTIYRYIQYLTPRDTPSALIHFSDVSDTHHSVDANQNKNKLSTRSLIGLPYLLAPDFSHFSAQMGVVSVERKWFGSKANQYCVDRRPRYPEQQYVRYDKALKKTNQECRHNGCVQRGKIVSIDFFYQNRKNSGGTTDDDRGHQKDRKSVV